MATFGLVHGAWHGAWCWDLLVRELRAAGHTAVAMDLPCEDRQAGFSDYADVVVRSLDGYDEVVLVGHSMGGITIPLVALRRPVRCLLFLCALVAEGPIVVPTGEPPTHPDGAFDSLVHHHDGSHSWPTLDTAIEAMYHDCEPQLAATAFARLRRQQTALWEGFGALERWPQVPSAYILGTCDRLIRPEWSRWIARERLGLRATDLPTGHSPMLACPARLAQVLVSSLVEATR